MVIVSNPKKLNGVIVTENLFGDMYVLLFTAMFLTQ
jgi:isocitrate/isopropylmalate dehydrogenase